MGEIDKVTGMYVGGPLSFPTMDIIITSLIRPPIKSGQEIPMAAMQSLSALETTPAERTYRCDQVKCSERGGIMCVHIESENYKHCFYHPENPQNKKSGGIK